MSRLTTDEMHAVYDNCFCSPQLDSPMTFATFMKDHFEALVAAVEAAAKPIPMQLPCPKCHELHIDAGEFATKPHHTHSCQICGLTWRPALVPTVGVRFLPGFKNEEIEADWKHCLPHDIRVACCECPSNTNAPGAHQYVFLNGEWYCKRHDPRDQ